MRLTGDKKYSDFLAIQRRPFDSNKLHISSKKMADKIILKKDSKTSKKLFHLKRNVFMLYAPRNIKIESTEFQIIDSGVLALTPKGGRGFVASKYKEDETIEISSGEQRLLVEIINRSCTSPIRMAKGCVLAFKISI